MHATRVVAGGWHIDKDYEKKIFDLANTFLHSGVTHYIGTFLEVLDSPSSNFAVEFYKAVSRDASVGEAVRIARERVIEHFGEKNIIWASYMLYGDPSYRIAHEKPGAESSPRRLSIAYYAITLVLILTAVLFWNEGNKTSGQRCTGD